ncbi:hypothetical protein QU487_21005 [Crenobacter sp. SG2305]|uniref:hypothetical protein n=1 Tax=Crenobacter oryzisoli TaxID=3056844 RepID=UPI0025AA4ED9|nr:hypothetical protein [Crenobacter sp. SG2305]MDN0085191.1 hypothetical protein [Crenobacter sp. SG2305]
MWSTTLSLAASETNSAFLRDYARRMLRQTQGEQPSRALPVRRRVLTAQVTPERKLTDLYARRESLQLKHMLHTLAAELGFASWEHCKAEIDLRPAALLDRYRLDLGAYGDYETNWFPDKAAVRQWQQQHGGYVLRYGEQAAAILTKQA